MKVLFAVQNPVLSDFFSYLLQKRKIEVSLVYNGLDAIQAVKENEWDAIVLGMTLDFFNGLEVLERLKEFEQTEKKILPPVIFLTRIHNEVLKQRAKELGARDFIFLPVKPKMLLDCIIQAKGL